ncbi:MAG: hypothetical protein IPF82_23375 [Blastocatellia bacterium]|nr:hypothetical protein [Blastocatellia bacterium]
MSLPLQPGAAPLTHVSGDWFSGPVSVRFERAADGSVKDSALEPVVSRTSSSLERPTNDTD